MLKPAILYKSELSKIHIELAYNKRYKWWICSSFSDLILKLPDNDWHHFYFVSIDPENRIVGYFHAGIDRENKSISSISMFNLREDGNILFARDLRDFMEFLLITRKFFRVEFNVVVGNPAEKIYDRFIEKYGGRVVGVFRKNVMLQNNRRYGRKFYEIFQKDFMNNYKKYHKIRKKRYLS